jgi:MFS family permease
LAAFVWNEHTAADPVLPLDLLLTPNIAASVIGSVIIGAWLFGIDTFIPLFVQGVKGGSATQAGRTITPLFVTWAVSVVVAAHVVLRFGFRRTAVTGSAIIALGVLGLAIGAADPERSGPLFFAAMIVIGLGMGPTSLSFLLDVQNSVARDRRGTATGAVIFARTMGGSLGVGILGGTMGLLLARRLATTTDVDIAAALRPETHSRLAPGQLLAVQGALGRSLRDVFFLMLAMAIPAIICSLGLRGGRAVSHADAGGGREAVEDALDLTVAVEH